MTYLFYNMALIIKMHFLQSHANDSFSHVRSLDLLQIRWHLTFGNLFLYVYLGTAE